MNSRPRELVSGSAQRDQDGCIVTVRELATDGRLVIHETGRGALACICSQLDALDGDWRIPSDSTPATIYRDLQGTREHEARDQVQVPEQSLLGRLGRLDLLDPSFAPQIPRGRKHF